MIKTVWISYDLGVKGDYPGIYGWLDNKKAVECGDSLAFIKYAITKDESIPQKIKNELEASVSFSKTDRIYIMWNEEGEMKGRFIIGKRKSSPWQGYGDSETEDDL